MEGLQRNQLVWLKSQAWRSVLALAWDAGALEVLSHWAVADLPLVVARQRADVSCDRLCLGLSAPTRWKRRRLALDVRSDAVHRVGSFPALAEVLNGLGPAWQAAPLSGLPVQVYGSFAWQAMTGMDYVHPASDLDVLVPVPNLHDAVQVASALLDWNAPLRVDGELVFAGGHALAWRELLHAHQGKVAQVLVKHRRFAALMTLDGLQSLLDLPLAPQPELCAV